MNFKKITPGYVVQVFNDAGEPLEQTFVAGDPVEYETEDGDPINEMQMPLGGNEYLPFDMVHPLDMSEEEEDPKVVFLEYRNDKFFWSLHGGARSIDYDTEALARKSFDAKTVQWK